MGVCSTACDAEGDEHEEAAEAAEKAHVEGSGAGAHGDEREEAVEGDRAAPNLSWTCKAIPIRRNRGRAKQDKGMRIGRWLRACKSPLYRILTGETAPLPIHLCLINDEAAFVLLRAATAAHREDARRREARMGALLIPMMV